MTKPHWRDRAEELRIIAGLMRVQEPALRLLQLADACEGLGEREEQREKTQSANARQSG